MPLVDGNVWTKDSVTKAPLILYVRSEPAPDGLVRLTYNPADGGTIATVFNQLNGAAVTVESVESLLEATGGLGGV